MEVPDALAPIVRIDEPLAPHTWFRLGGAARFLARPRTIEQLPALVRWAKQESMPIRILGGGSNVLVRDEGVDGLVIHLESPALSDVQINGRRIEAGAAVPLTALISRAARAGLAGLEILTGIPGTVGGAVRGNAGGRQGVIGPLARRVVVVDSTAEIQAREHDELSFSYRSSNLDEPVIVSVEFELEEEDPDSVVRRMRKIWIVKKERQPYGYQSCGCIFRNPTPEISAAYLIDQAGMQGVRIGGAEVSDRHPNFIVAHPGATSADVIQLIDHVRGEVTSRTGYQLEVQIPIW
jgi:UDP-N-acetylmuramate dehydrogenase